MSTTAPSYEGLPPGRVPTDNFPYLHVGERWYDPSTGRFLQRDPIGIHGGLNTYGYGYQTPVDVVDPDGLDLLDWAYTGYWSPPPGLYNAAVDAAALWWLTGPLPGYSKAIAFGGGAALGAAGNRSGPAGDRAVQVCFFFYQGWRAGRGLTGSPPIDDALDWFSYGAGAGSLFGPGPKLPRVRTVPWNVMRGVR